MTRRGLAVARELGLERSIGSFLAANVAWRLFDLGDWDNSDRVAAEALEREAAAAPRLHTIKGMLKLGRGDFPAAREHLELARRLNPSPYEVTGPLTGLAELAIWEGRYEDARAIVDQAVSGLQQLNPGDELPSPDAAEVCALGLRVEADCAERARAAQSPAGVQQAHRRAEPPPGHAPRADRPGCRSGEGWPLCLRRAGGGRVVPAPGPPEPQAVATGRRVLGTARAAISTAYARFREAEALLGARASRAQIQPVLGAAYQTAVALGAGPLRREIELLAGRGRLRLDEPAAAGTAPKAPPTPAASLGLTRREAEVLALLAEGRTNRQIGQALFITEKTASVHVSHILAKLGVAGRGEAAAIAHRLGLDKQ